VSAGEAARVAAAGRRLAAPAHPHLHPRFRSAVLPRGVHWIKAAVAAFEPERNAVVLDGCTVTGNVAAAGAGAYVWGNASVTLNATTFADNIAAGAGGALHLTPAPAIAAQLTGAAFLRNTAGDAGGAVALAAGASLNATGSTWQGNAALNGAAFYLSIDGAADSLPPPAVLLGDGCVASGNAANMSGGLWYTDATAPFAPLPSCAPGAACTGNSALNGADALAGVPLAFNSTVAALTAKPGAPLPAFSVSLYDGQGGLVVGAPDLTVTLVANVSGKRGGRAVPTLVLNFCRLGGCAACKCN
jgi:hypothetical protein